VKTLPFAIPLTTIFRHLLRRLRSFDSIQINSSLIIVSFLASSVLFQPLVFAQNATLNPKEICQNMVQKRLAMMNKQQWNKWRRTNDFSVSYVTNVNNLITIKANISLTMSADEFLDILHDVESIPDWTAQADSAHIEQLSPTRNILTLNFAETWPVGPRELIIESHINHCEPFIFIDVKNVERAPSNQDIIKMELLEGYWIIQSLSANKIEVHYVSSVDPKGDIPQWIAQKVALRNIWRTLSNLHQLAN